MKVVNRLLNLAGLERRQANYGDAAIAALLDQAQGTGTASANATSAVQTATRMIADPIRHRHLTREPGAALRRLSCRFGETVKVGLPKPWHLMLITTVPGNGLPSNWTLAWRKRRPRL